MTPTRKAPAKRPKRLAPLRKDAPQIRTSERSTYEACYWQWDHSYNQRLTPIVDAPALRFGTLIHAALEERYPPGIRRGPHPATTFARLYEEELSEAEEVWGFRDGDGEWANAATLGEAMLNNYVDTYGKDEEWKVIASEMTFQVPVFVRAISSDGERVLRPASAGLGPDLLPLPGVNIVPCRRTDKYAYHLFTYVGTMDGVWESRVSGRVLVNDYKTTKNDPAKEAAGKAILDEQATAYWTWGVDWLTLQKVLSTAKQQKLAGMLYTFLYKAAPDERPTNSLGQSLNKDGSVSKQQPAKRFYRDVVYRDREQTDRARLRAVQQCLEMMQRRAGMLPIRKAPGTGFPNQQCKGCAFFDICELDEIGQPYEDLRDATMKPWDPYDAHEIKEAEQR